MPRVKLPIFSDGREEDRRGLCMDGARLTWSYWLESFSISCPGWWWLAWLYLVYSLQRFFVFEIPHVVIALFPVTYWSCNEGRLGFVFAEIDTTHCLWFLGWEA